MSSNDKKPDWRTVDPDWGNLPAAIDYLRPYADKYGIIQFEEAIENYYIAIGKSELKDLIAVNKKSKKDSSIIDGYINEYFVAKDTPAGARMYFFFVMLAIGEDLGLLK